MDNLTTIWLFWLIYFLVGFYVNASLIPLKKDRSYPYITFRLVFWPVILILKGLLGFYEQLKDRS